jgi:hypothetical protein
MERIWYSLKHIWNMNVVVFIQGCLNSLRSQFFSIEQIFLKFIIRFFYLNKYYRKIKMKQKNNI